MKSWKLVALTVGLAGAMVACSSSSSPAPNGSGSGSGQGSSGQGSSKGSGSGSTQGGGAGGGTGCYEMTGSGESASCTYSSSTTPDYSCTAGLKSGSCPSSGLVGCCGDTITEDGYSVSSYVCYYDSTTASAAKMDCVSPDSWVTSAP